MTLLLLAIVGAVEAVVYQGRYRATHGSVLAAGFTTSLVCVLRVAFVTLGVAAVMREQWAWAIVAYAVPAAIVTAAVRWFELRRERANMDKLWGWGQDLDPREDLQRMLRASAYPTIEDFRRAEAEAEAEARDAKEYHTFELMQRWNAVVVGAEGWGWGVNRLRIGDVIAINGRDHVVYAKTTHPYFRVEARLCDLSTWFTGMCCTVDGAHRVAYRSLEAARRACTRKMWECYTDAGRARKLRTKTLHRERGYKWAKRAAAIERLSMAGRVA